jgi:hypothetical protein
MRFLGGRQTSTREPRGAHPCERRLAHMALACHLQTSLAFMTGSSLNVCIALCMCSMPGMRHAPCRLRQERDVRCACMDP